MNSSHDSSGTGSTDPTPRELRAARRRAHEEEKKKRAGGGGKGGKGGKGDKMGKGGGNQNPSADDRRRR